MYAAESRARWSAGVLVLMALIGACSGGKERQQEYLERAERYFEEGNYAKASVDVRNALQIDGDHARARYLYARVLEKEQDWERMFANLQRAVELAPTFAPARIDYGTMLVANEMYEEALTEAAAVLALKPAHPGAHALKAAAHLRMGALELAEQAAHEALRHGPGDVGAIGVLTEIYRQEDPELALDFIHAGLERHSNDAGLKLLEVSVFEAAGDVDAVERTYQSIIDVHPDNLYYRYLFVKFLEEQGRYQRALAELHCAIDAHPTEPRLKLWLVQMQVEHGRVDAARLALQDYLEADPRSADLVLALGQIYLLQGSLHEARDLFHRYMELDEDSETAQRARHALAQLELANGNREAGMALLERTLEQAPAHSEALIVRARLAMSEQNFDGAIADLRAAMVNAPESPEALLMLAQAYEAIGSLELATDTYRQLIRLQPNNQPALVALTRAALVQGEYQSAARIAATAVRLDPDNEQVAGLLVGALTEGENWREAIRRAQEIAEYRPTRALGRYLLGRIALARGQHLEAVRQFEHALAIDPGVKEILAGLVEAYYGMGAPDRAFQAVQRHSRAHPRHVHALELLAEMHAERGEVSRSEALLQQAISRDAENPSPYVRLGQRYLEQGDPERGLSVLQQGLKRNPLDRSLLLENALAQGSQGRYRQAAELYERAIAVGGGLMAQNNLAMLYADHLQSPANLDKALALMRAHAGSDIPEVLDTLGWVHYRLGRFEPAIRYLRSAIAKGGHEPIMRYHLGLAYLANDQQQDARRELLTVVEEPGQSGPKEHARQILASLDLASRSI